MGIGIVDGPFLRLVAVARSQLTPAEWAQWRRAITKASEILFDATQGQLQIGDVYFADDGNGEDTADVILYPSGDPRSAAGGSATGRGRPHHAVRQGTGPDVPARVRAQHLGPGRGVLADADVAPDRHVEPRARPARRFRSLLRAGRRPAGRRSGPGIADDRGADRTARRHRQHVDVDHGRHRLQRAAHRRRLDDRQDPATGRVRDGSRRQLLHHGEQPRRRRPPLAERHLDTCRRSGHRVLHATRTTIPTARPARKTATTTPAGRPSSPCPGSPGSPHPTRPLPVRRRAPTPVDFFVLDPDPRFAIVLDRSHSMADGTKLADAQHGAVYWVEFARCPATSSRSSGTTTNSWCCSRSPTWAR